MALLWFITSHIKNLKVNDIGSNQRQPLYLPIIFLSINSSQVFLYKAALGVVTMFYLTGQLMPH
jgi:hypothetical protein